MTDNIAYQHGMLKSLKMVQKWMDNCDLTNIPIRDLYEMISGGIITLENLLDIKKETLEFKPMKIPSCIHGLVTHCVRCDGVKENND